MMGGYNYSHNGLQSIFKTNSFDPPQEPAESNVWGLKHGAGPFWRMYEKVKGAVEYAHAPTDRYIEDSETVETPPFDTPLGENTTVVCGDAQDIASDEDFDAVITDPPYYDNIIYSEVSDYFHVWQKILLEDEYDCFTPEKTPRNEIVANPAQQKGPEEFEAELGEAFDIIHDSLKEDGVLAFTYHHSESESWGELLEALCNADFVVTATYPVTADLQKLTKGESVSFDIIVVARPVIDRAPTSWNSLRRDIVRTARSTREKLETDRDLSAGDIGVIEMGRCFYEYSKHHGEVRRAGQVMSAKEVVDEIYGIIQENSELGETEVFLELLDGRRSTYDELNKHLKGSSASEERMKEMRLYRMNSGDLALGTWDDERRQAYVQNKVTEGNGDVTDLDRAQFLRYRYETGKSTAEYVEQWNTDDLRELCEGLAEATRDETYLKIVGVDSSLTDFLDE
jgi:hypothetical protein